MLNLDTTPKKQLVSVLRQLQGLRDVPVGAITTLTRLPNRDLQATIAELCGDAYIVDDDARAVRRPNPEPAPAPAPEPKPTRGRGRKAATNGVAANGHDERVVAGIAVVERPAPKSAPAPAAEQSPVVPREGIITLLHAENPKRDGSASHARYALLRSGMTVAEYLTAAGSRGRRTLRKALRQGHVRVDAPPATGGTE
jgi:hypothetical protein